MQHLDDMPLVVEDLPNTGRSWRIAMVTETYPPEVNGVANTVAKVVEGLRARNHTVQLVRPRQAQVDQTGGHDEVLTKGMAIPMYAHLRMGAPSKGRLVKLWSMRRPDVVHIATEGPLGWSALQAAVKLKLPVCSDFRTNFQAYSQHYGIGWLQKPIMAYLRKFHNRCHSTMVPTEALRNQLEALGLNGLSVVARGVDTRLFSPQKRSDNLRAQWGAAPGDVVVLHVGRLAAEKNLTVLQQAFERILQTEPRARIVVVGDGPARAQMQASCPQAHFAGFQSGETLAAHYASSDIFLFPSLTETYGNVTPEAMASGLAVVAFNDAAAGQLITHWHNGLLAPKTDPAEFLRLSQELAADASMREKFGPLARFKVQEHGWEAILRSIEETYTLTVQRANTLQMESTLVFGTS
jgi:glycosyltransferase involved in cell wall biosynthesis